MSKERRLTHVKISRPNHFKKCRTCPTVAKALGRAFEDNLTYRHERSPMTLQFVEINCNIVEGAKSKQMGGEFVDGPNTNISIKVSGEVVFFNQNGSGEIQNRHKLLTYGVNCPHHFPSTIKESELKWKTYE